jgi:putative copper resistance protein D
VIDGPLAAARAVHFAATLLLEGGIVFGFLVLRAAEDDAQRHFSRFLNWAFAAALAAALISGAAWLVLLARDIAGASVWAAVSDGTAWTLLTRTQFGGVWLWRAAGFVLLAPVLLRRNARSSPRVKTIALALSLLLTGSLSWSGHGAATPGALGDVHLNADALHLIAAGIWVGGLLPFAVYMTRMRGSAAMHAAHRFSAYATAAVLVLLATGVVNAWFILPDMHALTATPYGRLLLAKLALFLLMLAFAGVNRFVLVPQLASEASAGRSATRLAVHSGCEIALGLVILGIVGVLGILDPADHPHAAATHETSRLIGLLL